MTPQEFSKRHAAEWEAFAEQLGARGRKKIRADFPERYRQICAQLALARDRHYPPIMVERLNQLVLAGQQRLYEHQGGLWQDCVMFISGGFPALVRRHSRTFWVAAAFFYIPTLLVAIAIWLQPELIYSIMPADKLSEFEQMYNPAHPLDRGGSDKDFAMFGFYIRNNIGVGFQTFAGGIFFGVGSLFFLVSNALSIGAVAGHLTRIGFSESFLSFIVTHGAFELTAIVLSGMAGFMLGMALIAPGNHTRRDALILQSRDAVRIVYGAAGLFAVAAVFEGFWSGNSHIPPMTKYIVGGFCWLLVTLYFALAGRRTHAA
jgi:uncharacterized membrane protein SpoIIM required for sporulation